MSVVIVTECFPSLRKLDFNHNGLEHLSRLECCFLRYRYRQFLACVLIASQPVGAVDVLISGETPKDGLVKEAIDAVQAILARPVVNYITAHKGNEAKSVIKFPIDERLASYMTRDP